MTTSDLLLGELDLYLFNEGRHLRLWEQLGAQVGARDGVVGTRFAVWAPNAERVSVVGDFNAWDAARHPMQPQASSGVWACYVPDLGDGTLYKYAIATRTGDVLLKTDPVAFKLEQAPGFASIVQGPSAYPWGDASWMTRRAGGDPPREPVHVYEVHLGSWRHAYPGQPLSYRDLAPQLAAHVRALGFTHVELLPIQEHPFGGSWGYQVGGYYAPRRASGRPTISGS